MSKLTPVTKEDLKRWIGINLQRIKRLRLLTDNDIARFTGLARPDVNDIQHARFQTVGLPLICRLCNALAISPAQLLSRPDSMELDDFRTISWEIRRKKQRRHQTREQQERQALLESLGLDSDDE